MKKILKEAVIYMIIAAIIVLAAALFLPSKTGNVISVAWNSLLGAIKIMISVFIFIGLLQVWVSTEKLSALLGKEAGWKRFALSSIIPIFIGGSLFTVFPMLKTLKDKGASYAALFAFITAWSGKGPLIPLEIYFLGLKFSVLRILMIIPFSVVMGLLGEFIMEVLEKRKTTA
ncbi:MAG: hypothetical protein QHH01_07625 [Spirochaetales bacterium]|nr:hypothetical protein [Spirochaetales bacterium]